MTPYYEDGTVTIYHGDCREVLPVEADATITDPPYGTGSYATDVIVLDVAMLAAFPHPAAVFGWPERLVGLCVAAGIVPDEWVTWWPTNGALRGMNTSGLWREVECIAVFGEGNWSELRSLKNANSAAQARANYNGPNRRIPGSSAVTRREGDVWRDSSPGLGMNGPRLHPNEKPVSVLSRLVQALTSLGQVVFDPFAGSGTTLRAAKDCGRRAVGIEIEERYCEVAANRCAQEVLPLAVSNGHTQEALAL